MLFIYFLVCLAYPKKKKNFVVCLFIFETQHIVRQREEPRLIIKGEGKIIALIPHELLSLSSNH